MPSSRRMLLISPAFFGYEHDIRCAIEANGTEVDYFDERPSNSSFAKAIYRVGGRLIQPYVRSYFRRILRQINRVAYTHVLVIKGEVVPPWFIREVRRLNPHARLMYYSFDAIPENSNCLELFAEMDDLFSFDSADVEKYPRLNFKPLFFAEEFSAPEQAAERKNELAFVGTLHSDRHRFVSNLFEAFPRTYKFFYVPARWFFFVNKYLTRNFGGVSWEEVRFRSLAKGEVARVFQSARAVLDLQRDKQSGLTMRTFEVLASGAVLVTGNSSIRDAPFFDPNWIIVVDDYESPDASRKLQALLSALPQDSIPIHDFEKYSVRNWVLDFVS